ncbi:extracellular solute-binding protein [Trichlorobacter ammonificans]|uniref:ABC transporter substrate-binding protein n=1 Tax=Trichlorobacter ammonificans TaxID=2916410 RepID=A0ABN8HGT0_9BACT|nr:extracellular solute-binding protein [Trichlorobacter ammonificans]CAH2031969.1 ABC transporter substrate-binding protein [Trichlorobacter ammonificans]
MKSSRLITIICALLALTAGGVFAAQTVIQYDCIPNYANWGGVTKAYQQRTGVVVPPDMKGSSPSMAALEAERNNPKADCVYYSGAIGYQAASKGLHDSYKPKGWEKIPAGLKDPNGTWWTVHTGHIAILVNTAALKGKPVPRSFADLLKPIYQGMVVYDDPRFNGTGFTFVAGISTVLGGKDLTAGFDYLKKLDANILKYNKDNIYNELLRGEVPIWINADGNGLKAKHVDKGSIEVVIPAEGTITMPLVMALVKGAPRKEAAQNYLDWLLGDEAQRLMAESFFQPVMPVKLDPALQAKFPPKSAYAKAKVIPLDRMAAQADNIKKRWEREIEGGR